MNIRYFGADGQQLSDTQLQAARNVFRYPINLATISGSHELLQEVLDKLRPNEQLFCYKSNLGLASFEGTYLIIAWEDKRSRPARAVAICGEDSRVGGLPLLFTVYRQGVLSIASGSGANAATVVFIACLALVTLSRLVTQYFATLPHFFWAVGCSAALAALGGYLYAAIVRRSLQRELSII